MKNPDHFDNPGLKITSKLDVGFLMLRIREACKNLQTRFSKENPDVVLIAIAILNRQYFNDTNNELNGELARLASDSESLINLPNANTPEIKAQRKVVADKINNILEKQAEFEKEMGIKDTETIIAGASSDQLSQANLLVEKIVSDLDWIGNPKVESN